MPLHEAIVPTRLALPLLELLRERQPYGVALTLLEAGFEEAELRCAEASITLARYEALLNVVASKLERTDLAFDVGRRITIDSHGALSAALHGCRTLDEVLTISERYYRLVSPAFGVQYRRGAQQHEWRVRIVAPMSGALLRYFLEVHAVSFHTHMVAMFGQAPAIEGFLSMAAPAHAWRYRALSPMRVHFSATALPELRWVIASAVALQPFARSVTPGSLPERPPLRAASGYAQWCELMLREAEGCQPTLGQLAEMLDMSARSLTRHLGGEGVNLRALGIGVRHERGCALLEQGREPLVHIAHRLGYADLATFIRAFRRRAGITPAAYRRRAAG